MTNVPTVTDTPQQFPDLTPMMEAFVLELVANGGKKEKAAIKAGYSKTSARVIATNLLKVPKVCDAIAIASTRVLATHAPKALAQIAALSAKASSEYVRLEASKDLLSRLGLEAPKRVNLGGNLSVVYDLGDS